MIPARISLRREPCGPVRLPRQAPPGHGFMFQRLLIVWLTLLGLAAFFWDRWLPGVFDPFVFTKPLLNYLFAATMFAIGATLPREEIRQVAARWPKVLGGTAVQFTAMPLLGWGMPIVFGLDRDATIGTIIVGCAPDAMASSVLTLMARGNVSYSVSLTITSTLISPLVVPAVMYLALGQHVDFPAGRAMWELCWMVVLPVVAGHLVSRVSARCEALARSRGAGGRRRDHSLDHRSRGGAQSPAVGDDRSAAGRRALGRDSPGLRRRVAGRRGRCGSRRPCGAR